MSLAVKVQRLLDTPEVGIADTTLRDAHQSLWATRMTNEMALGAFPEIDEAGFFLLEVWGGATFDTDLRYLAEDPWENLERLKERARNTPLQMLLRGQNGVGYGKIPNDVLRAFIHEARRAGIDIFRTFDAMNDPRNLENAVRFVREAGGHNQVCASYTESPLHTPEYYIGFVEILVECGLLDPGSPDESFCIKDMAGVAKPGTVARVVRAVRAKFPRLLIQVHSHYSSGLAPATCFAAVEAGANVIDGAISTLSQSTSLPAVETLAEMFGGASREVNLWMDLLPAIRDYFLPYAEQRHLAHSHVPVDVSALEHKIPGGMWSNYIVQLSDMGLSAKTTEVLKLFPVIWKKLGYPPLVTPTSQIVGVETAFTILRGDDYQRSRQLVDYVNGVYGKPMGQIDPGLQRRIVGHADLIDYDAPMEIPPSSLDQCRAELDAQGLLQSDRDAISYAMFPAQALPFFKWRAGQGPNPREKATPVSARPNCSGGTPPESRNPTEFSSAVGAPEAPTWSESRCLVALRGPGGRRGGGSSAPELHLFCPNDTGPTLNCSGPRRGRNSFERPSRTPARLLEIRFSPCKRPPSKCGPQRRRDYRLRPCERTRWPPECVHLERESHPGCSEPPHAQAPSEGPHCMPLPRLGSYPFSRVRFPSAPKPPNRSDEGGTLP
ncbi:MAG: pyruvate carboxylase subunit B [Nitrospinota bacterium]